MPMEESARGQIAQRFSLAAVGVTMLIAGTITLGWLLNADFATHPHPSLGHMKFNTSSSLLLLGTSLLMGHRAGVRRLVEAFGRVPAGIAMILGALTLAQFLFGWNLAIDQLFRRDPLGSLTTIAPGRPAPGTALCIFLIGLGIVLQDFHILKLRPSLWLAGAAAFVAFAFFLAEEYNSIGIAQFEPYSRMSVHSSFCLILLSFSLLLNSTQSQSSLATLLFAPGPAGMIVRRLVPVAMAMPLIDSLRIWGERAHYYDAGFGVAIDTATTVALLLLVISTTARLLELTDQARRRAEAKILSDSENLRLANEKIVRTNTDLERFNRLAVGREQRMIELKRTINEQSRELGREAPYHVKFDEDRVLATGA